MPQDDAKRVREEEAAKREELSARLGGAMDDVGAKLATFRDEQARTVEENAALRGRLADIAKMVEVQAAKHEAEMKAKGLELKIEQTKLAQAQEIARQQDAVVRAACGFAERALMSLLVSCSAARE